MKSMRRALVIFAVGSAFAFGGAPRKAEAQLDRGEAAAARANELTLANDFARARAELARADAASPSVIQAKARLALYEDDCDEAVSLLSQSDFAGNEEGQLLSDVARGCARATAATVVDKDEAARVVVRWQDEDDRALFPLVVETVDAARKMLSRELGVEWKEPTRITFVRDLLSLSAMTGLPFKAAETTGTVAVAKWGRVTILSPRASRRGYPWRDTLAHELTHLAISMRSLDRAPLWLQEGVARLQETRWRPPGPFDDKPSIDSVVQRGIELKLDRPLDKLGPSIAMLPTADAAMVAFAEVSSFVRFYVDTQPEGALSKLLGELRTASSIDEALTRTSGATLSQWDARWRAQLAKRPKVPLSPLYGLGAAPSGTAEARERVRLAELLFGREHPAEALLELDKIPEAMTPEPSLRYVRSRVLEAKGDTAAAEALVRDPKVWTTSYGPCWALAARLADARGDAQAAEAAHAEALAHTPLDVESACFSARGQPPTAALCEAARRRGEPDLGKASD